MPDILIRNFPAEDLARLDEHAARLGVSRSDYLRRRLQQEARRTATAVTAGDLARFGETFADLADAEVMYGAGS
jgi:hypothetical protein